jgi:hypothetical protein
MIKVGDVFETTRSGFCTVLEYNSARNVRVIFENGSETYCTAGNLRNGNVKNPNHPNVCGIGFIGIGIYSQKTHRRIYMVWSDMLRRCYNEDYKNLHPTYRNCTVCERWKNFQNFAHDYLLMVGSDLNWFIDKDCLIKGNKIYSPETCRLVPREVNSFLVKCDAGRGECCIGVTYYPDCKINPYMAVCNIEGRQKYLGCYKTEQEAYLVYKPAKEAEAKRLANFYKDVIDPDIYEAMMNYVVDEND